MLNSSSCSPVLLSRLCLLLHPVIGLVGWALVNAGLVGLQSSDSPVLCAGLRNRVSWVWERGLLSGVVRADLWQRTLCLPPCRMGGTCPLAALCTAPVCKQALA